MYQILSAEPKCDGWPWISMDLNMNGLMIIIITAIVIIVLVMKIMIIKLWICLKEICGMNKDDDVDKNKDGALNSKAKQYFDSSSDEDVKLSAKYLDR